jgi:hypothetical protein
MGKLLDRWRAAKKLFKDTARVKKPSPLVEGTFTKKGLGIEKAIKKLETAEATHKVGLKAKVFADWKAAVTEFKIAKTNYLIVLDATVGKEPAGADKTAYRKGIAVLKTQLNSLDKTIASHTAGYQAVHNGQTTALANLAATAASKLDAALDAAEAFIAQVKANPTPERFNTDIMTTARDVTQAIANLHLLHQQGNPAGRAKPKAAALLVAWANKGREVDDNAAEAAVLAELKLFEDNYKQIKAWAG